VLLHSLVLSGDAGRIKRIAAADGAPLVSPTRGRL
jgi:hypothetical protein